MKGAKSTSYLWPVMKRVLAESGRRYWSRYALAIALMSVAGGCTALAAWIMKDVINEIFVARDRAAMMLIPLAIVGLFLLRGISMYLGEITLSRVGNRIVAETQARLYRHILRQDSAFFKIYPSGDILTRITSNAASMRDMLNQITLSLGRDLITLIALLARDAKPRHNHVDHGFCGWPDCLPGAANAHAENSRHRSQDLHDKRRRDLHCS